MTLFIISIICFILFIIFYVKDQRQSKNGIILMLSIIFTLMGFINLHAMNYSNNYYIVIQTILILIYTLIPLLMIGLALMLFYNGSLMLRRESRRLVNALPLFLGIILIAISALFLLYILQNTSELTNFFFLFFIAVLGYFTFLFLSFLLSTFLYQLNFSKYNQDFLIILGSGLIQDKVPRLLANRLDKAIQFAQRQREANGREVIFIVSGGKGADESVSEAYAMSNYLLEKGIPKNLIKLEDKSVNTFQNMLLSKKIMLDLKPTFNSLFITNNFHLFRAGIYAKKSGLQSQGLGAKTALYYLPNALIREFIAILMLRKKVHFFCLTGLVLLFVLLFSLLATS
ncbi:YdcF family protein [Listeria monocytogenes]|nr:YdcF family protein [Listeria monocytogenes]